jgi:NTE family protein
MATIPTNRSPGPFLDQKRAPVKRDFRPKTAFVFDGGGSLGAVEVGMLKALISHGIQADFVVGSSVGALNAAYFAGEPTGDGVQRLEQIWLGVRRRDVFPIGPLRGFLGFFGWRDHLLDPTPLRRLIERNIQYRRLEEARIPCHVVATDLMGGGDVRFSSGPAVEIILASAAIPALFPPVRIGDRYLIDGGIVNNSPISSAVELGATRVIVLPTGFSCSIEKSPRGVLGMALHASNLLIARQLVLDAQRFAEKVELIVIPPLCPLAVSSYDFSRTRELIDRAAKMTERWLDKVGLAARGVPSTLACGGCATGDSISAA